MIQTRQIENHEVELRMHVDKNHTLFQGLMSLEDDVHAIEALFEVFLVSTEGKDNVCLHCDQLLQKMENIVTVAEKRHHQLCAIEGLICSFETKDDVSSLEEQLQLNSEYKRSLLSLQEEIIRATDECAKAEEKYVNLSGTVRDLINSKQMLAEEYDLLKAKVASTQNECRKLETDIAAKEKQYEHHRQLSDQTIKTSNDSLRLSNARLEAVRAELNDTILERDALAAELDALAQENENAAKALEKEEAVMKDLCHEISTLETGIACSKQQLALDLNCVAAVEMELQETQWHSVSEKSDNELLVEQLQDEILSVQTQIDNLELEISNYERVRAFCVQF